MAGQVGAYLGAAVTPYAIQGAQQSMQKGNSDVMTAAPFIGITPAPASVSRSDFEAYIHEKGQAFHTSKTPEGADRAQARADAIKSIQQNGKPDLSQFSQQERLNIYKSARTPVQESMFRRLTIQQQLSALDKATDDEVRKFKLKMIAQHSLALHGNQLEDEDRVKARALIQSK